MMDLSKVLLGEYLTQTERLYLRSLPDHDGFPVLKKLFDQVCRLATEDVVKLDPEDEHYERKLAARTQRARDFNEFAGCIIKSFNANVQIANDIEKKEKHNAGTNSRPEAN
jgi:hypothetical protein